MQLKGLEFAELTLASSGPSYQSRLMFSNYGANDGIVEPNKRITDYVLWMLRHHMGGSAHVQNLHNEEIIPRAFF